MSLTRRMLLQAMQLGMMAASHFRSATATRIGYRPLMSGTKHRELKAERKRHRQSVRRNRNILNARA